MFKIGDIINTSLGYVKINDPEILTNTIIRHCLSKTDIKDMLQKNILTFNIEDNAQIN
jgi:hypothetical protein